MKCVPAKPITDAVLLSCNVPEADYAVYDPTHTYASGDFCISLTTHRVYQSLQSANTGQDPTLATTSVSTWWLDYSSTNRWSLFDNYVASQTTNPGSIVISLDFSQCDTVALFDISASTVEINVQDSNGNVLYDEVIQMLYDDYVDWAGIFFNNPELQGKVYRNLPLFYGTILTITVSAPGGTAACGQVLIGRGRFIGTNQYGFTEGILDFSTKNRNTFGQSYLHQGDYADTSTFNLWILDNVRPQIKNFLTSVRATPCAWYLDNTDVFTEEDLLLFAFYEDFKITVQYDTVAVCAMTLQGLT